MALISQSRIARQRIEARVLGGLKDKLMAPALVAEFTRSYQPEINAEAKEASARSAGRI